jgi:hypothetical protein
MKRKALLIDIFLFFPKQKAAGSRRSGTFDSTLLLLLLVGLTAFAGRLQDAPLVADTLHHQAPPDIQKPYRRKSVRAFENK